MMGWIGDSQSRLFNHTSDDYVEVAGITETVATLPSTEAVFTMRELRQLASEFVNITHCDMVYRLFLSGFLAWIEKAGDGGG